MSNPTDESLKKARELLAALDDFTESHAAGTESYEDFKEGEARLIALALDAERVAAEHLRETRECDDARAQLAKVAEERERQLKLDAESRKKLTRDGLVWLCNDQVKQLAAKDRRIEELRALLGKSHLYAGLCPDDLQPESRDPECPVCAALDAQGGETKP